MLRSPASCGVASWTATCICGRFDLKMAADVAGQGGSGWSEPAGLQSSASCQSSRRRPCRAHQLTTRAGPGPLRLRRARTPPQHHLRLPRALRGRPAQALGRPPSRPPRQPLPLLELLRGRPAQALAHPPSRQPASARRLCGATRPRRQAQRPTVLQHSEDDRHPHWHTPTNFLHDKELKHQPPTIPRDSVLGSF